MRCPFCGVPQQVTVEINGWAAIDDDKFLVRLGNTVIAHVCLQQPAR